MKERYKCLWCEFKATKILGLRLHIHKIHKKYVYSVRRAGYILRLGGGYFTREQILVAALCYTPKHNKDLELRKRAIYLIKEHYGTYDITEEFNPLHFI